MNAWNFGIGYTACWFINELSKYLIGKERYLNIIDITWDDNGFYNPLSLLIIIVCLMLVNRHMASDTRAKNLKRAELLRDAIKTMELKLKASDEERIE